MSTTVSRLVYFLKFYLKPCNVETPKLKPNIVKHWCYEFLLLFRVRMHRLLEIVGKLKFILHMRAGMNLGPWQLLNLLWQAQAQLLLAGGSRITNL